MPDCKINCFTLRKGIFYEMEATIHNSVTTSNIPTFALNHPLEGSA